jgi:uncharacterized protein
MTSNQAVQTLPLVGLTKELGFAGDNVFLAGQMDYPATPMPANGYPLLFILHHAGCNTRECYNDYAQMALDSGYAVFRWDKRGTGRSGASGRGSTTQDAVNAYEVALEQPHVNPRRTTILAQAAGTGLLGSSFGLFARVQHPYGVILVSNMLDAEAVLAIDSRLKIIMSEEDWNPWEKFAEEACIAHNNAYPHGASFYVAKNADRTLNDLSDEQNSFHDGARKVIQDWLNSLHPTSKLI